MIKDQYVYEPNVIDEVLHKIYLLTYEKNNVDYQNYISREKEFSLLNSNNHIKMIQSELRSSNNKLTIDENEDVKKIEYKNEKI